MATMALEPDMEMAAISGLSMRPAVERTAKCYLRICLIMRRGVTREAP